LICGKRTRQALSLFQRNRRNPKKNPLLKHLLNLRNRVSKNEDVTTLEAEVEAEAVTTAKAETKAKIPVRITKRGSAITVKMRNAESTVCEIGVKHLRSRPTSIRSFSGNYLPQF
jgi:hypothetical protein